MTNRDLSTYGFLGYPLLQTADIIIYKAHKVPVGIDQVPHVELSREVARRFNFFYGPVFPLPEPLLTEVPKLLGIDGRKMSKSYDNAIFISDPPRGDPAQDERHVHRPQPDQDGATPGIRTSATSFPFTRSTAPRKPSDRVNGIAAGRPSGCVEDKRHLAETLVSYLAPIQEERARYLKDPRPGGGDPGGWLPEGPPGGRPDHGRSAGGDEDLKMVEVTG